jgi:hypothetical protein
MAVTNIPQMLQTGPTAQSQARMKLALQMLQQQPVRHPVQGWANGLSQIAGTYLMLQEGKRADAKQAGIAETMKRATEAGTKGTMWNSPDALYDDGAGGMASDATGALKIPAGGEVPGSGYKPGIGAMAAIMAGNPDTAMAGLQLTQQEIVGKQQAEAARAQLEEQRAYEKMTLEEKRAWEAERFTKELGETTAAELRVAAAKGSGGPFEGTSIAAQDRNVLINADIDSPEYAQAWHAAMTPKTTFDPATNRTITIRPPDLVAMGFTEPTWKGRNPVATPIPPTALPEAPTAQPNADGQYEGFTPEDTSRAEFVRDQMRQTFASFEQTGNLPGGRTPEEYLSFLRDKSLPSIKHPALLDEHNRQIRALEGIVGGGVAQQPPPATASDNTGAVTIETVDGGLTKLSSEVAARYSLGLGALQDMKADDFFTYLEEGGLTGPVDNLMSVTLGRGRGGEIKRTLDRGSEAIVRLMTGAGMNGDEAAERAALYQPHILDDGPTLAQKAREMQRVLGQLILGAVKGGLSQDEVERIVGDGPQSGGAPSISTMTAEQLLDINPIELTPEQQDQYNARMDELLKEQ